MIASKFYGNPSHRMKVVGVTGTNGEDDDGDAVVQELLRLLGRKAGSFVNGV